MKIVKVADGWKTAIAALYWFAVMQILPIWYPDGPPGNWPKILATVGSLLTFVGVGHKIVKATHAPIE